MPAPKGHAPYPGCETGGRPTKYTPEFIDNEAEALMKWTHAKQGNIFVEFFCFERGYSDKRISEFVKVSEKFSEAYEIFKTKQKASLFYGSISRQLFHPGCALVLSHHHGIVAKTEQKVTTDVTHPLAFAMEGEGDSGELVSE